MFMSALLGGPDPYTGREIGAVHAHLQPRLKDTHFNALLKHFRASLNEVGVKEDKTERVMNLLEARRDVVLNRSNSPRVRAGRGRGGTKRRDIRA